MEVIFHPIRLHPGASPEHFEAWVRETDYTACAELPSVNAFTVHNVSRSPTAQVHFFEIIWVSSREAFERDTQTSVFRRLALGFSEMASVVDEFVGQPIEPGYLAA
ncbi:RedY protein [Streptomyces sp. SID13666]|uniref:RedY protein n=1 Tax=unclassified Streptomyces TaxID=2593676 RepID=UPI001105FF17|nr:MULTISPECIES: RedY protein [unclassified Streptomyces]NEA57177.1 RedY protein [Streptomyces sp. SID13666]NEA74271.1 RedY protein [Streptomyces sp. SID13588]QNA71969.1 RedY protein [Streptomyces sp. So13.3]